jgi:two-component system, LuxR family, response regulator FixJ
MQTESTVFIVDDDKAIRDGIRLLVKSVGLSARSFADAREFLDHYHASEPGCLVLDVRMPGMSGIELHEEMIRRQINLPVIFLTGHGDLPMGVRAMKAGAADFIEKPPSGQSLLAAIQTAIAADTKRRLHERERKTISDRKTHLTEREHQVMEYLVQGRTDKQIAGKLNIGARGVAFHRASILEKMKVESVVELVYDISKVDL